MTDSIAEMPSQPDEPADSSRPSASARLRAGLWRHGRAVAVGLVPGALLGLMVGPHGQWLCPGTASAPIVFFGGVSIIGLLLYAAFNRERSPGIGPVLVFVAALAIGVKGAPWIGAAISLDDGRIRIPAAGVSIVLPPGWEQRTPKHCDDMFVAAWFGNEEGPGVILSDAHEALDTVPSTLDELEVSALAARSAGSSFGGTRSAASEQVTLPLGTAVRVRYITWVVMFGQWSSIDYWFYSGDRVLVLTYFDGPSGTDERPPESPADLEALVQSIRLE